MVLFTRTLRFLIPLKIVSKPRFISKQTTSSILLAEVGRLEQPKLQDNYETGQLFLHRVFGYRGVILFPWTARVYDRDLHNPVKSQKKPIKSASSSGTAESAEEPTKSSPSDDEPSSHTSSAKSESSSAATKEGTKEVKGKVHTFYQVLIDSRDYPFIRAQTESVTFLGHQDSKRSLYAVPGLDYVAHDDVLPYTSADKHPLFHELFDKFLQHAPEKTPPFEARDTLKGWQEKNQQWLELSDVHKETTENIRVTVIPFYMGCKETPASSVYWWRYCIRLENMGDMSVQLRERHWRIFSLSGTLETVRGRGVVGQEPILSPRLPAFQYSSHVSLQAPSGHMWGTFRLEREDGYTFDCKIPPFSLESKPDEINPTTTTTTTTSKSSKPPSSGGSGGTHDDLE